MTESTPSFPTRISLAFRVFFRALSDPEVATGVLRLLRGGPPRTAESKPAAAATAPPAFRQTLPDAALQLLGLLQQEGRLIDFLEEDVTGFSDAEVGAAARVVHEGCRMALRNHFTIVPVREEHEGARVTLKEGFDASSVRLTGNVVGKPPFTGNLVHRGWRATQVKLPSVAEGHDTRVLAAAEVEL
jgi:Domain of unknown function (DUF2760)